MQGFRNVEAWFQASLIVASRPRLNNGDTERKQVCFAGCMQTLPNATSSIGKVFIFSKIAVTFEPLMQFRYFMTLEEEDSITELIN